jgi:hypothetical protein
LCDFGSGICVSECQVEEEERGGGGGAFDLFVLYEMKGKSLQIRRKKR